MPDVLSVTDLRFGWPGSGRDLLDVEALSLAPGESLFLRGPSGCGKSTLLAAIAGMVDIGTRQIAVAGVDVGTLKGGARDRFRAEHIGLIFQVFNLVPWLSALDNVLLTCRFSAARKARTGASPEAEARRLLSALDLAESHHRAPANRLSIGQQQRVAAARALIGRPQLILADEPTSALDEDAKLAFAGLLARECAAADAALLFVSHDRGLEDRFDRVVDFRALGRRAVA